MGETIITLDLNRTDPAEKLLGLLDIITCYLIRVTLWIYRSAPNEAIG
jgi:hypothetical protein